MIARRAQIEHQLEAGHHPREERIGGARFALVGVIDDDERVVGEGGQGILQALELIGEAVAAIEEVGADARGTPWRIAQEMARLHVVELDLTGRVTIEVGLQDFRGAVELGKIVACENLRARISARRADDARALVASHLDVNFAGRQMRHREVEQQQLVLGRHAGNFGENVGDAAILWLTRGLELPGVIEVGPVAAAVRDEGVEVQVKTALAQ